MKITTRFAPSPTGFLHLGGARTALFNYVFAKKFGGKFVLRIEDTDKERSQKEYEEDILSGLNWLNLDYDEFFRQSERSEIYKKYLERLINTGQAYVSKEESGEGERKEVIRFKNPNKKIKFKDEVRGEVEFDTAELKDFVIAKSPTEPLYHLAVVIDDFEMNISHVIRGEDHISNTPRQILIQKALEFPEVIYAHIPLILAPDRSKLSKRHGAVSLIEFKKFGYLPEAMINFLMMLGWNPGDDREILSLDEIIKVFDLKKVQKSGAIFNLEKLDWINQQYIKNLNPEERNKIIQNWFLKNKKNIWVDSFHPKLFEIINDRIKKWGDIERLIEDGELDYFFEKPEIKKEKIAWKNNPDLNSTGEYLKKIVEILENLQDEEFNATIIKDRLMIYAEEKGRGEVLWPARYTLTGKEKSPDPFILSEILGKKETLERWKKAIEILEN